MIKKTALQPRLAEIGKIKTGGKGETRQGKNGPYQLPIRYGHFVVTTTERDPQTGNFKPDMNVMSNLDPKPRELPIRLLFDDITMNLQTEFAMYHGKKKACFGDGETATRLVKKGNKLTDESKQIQCENWDCEFFKDSKCKTSARLFCTIPQSMELGGVHIFRTHSSNSVRAMTGALLFFKENTNGILQGLPLKLKMVKKQTEEHGEIDFVTIVLDGLEMMEMRKAAALELSNRKALGVDIKSFENEVRGSGLLIDHDKPEDVEAEYYQAGEPDKITGSSQNDTVKKLKKQAEPNEQKRQDQPDNNDSPV